MKRLVQLSHSRQYLPTFNMEDLESSVMQKILNKEPTHFFTVPSNVYKLLINGCGGGAAGKFADFEKKLAGDGGCAGQIIRRVIDVKPGQKLEIYVGRGGCFMDKNNKQSLTWLQIQQNLYEHQEPEDTIVVDCLTEKTVYIARAALGFSGGRAKIKEQNAESGIASMHNAGNGFCNADGKWIGYGGGGGGGRHGGAGGSVFSNCKTTKPGDAEPYTGAGGGGAALVLNDHSAKHFFPGSGASGYLNITYEL